MKKIFTYIAIATALIATSCVQENLDGTSSEGQVSLELFCTDLETRAAGDDAFNENKITHFDYFFFSDAEGTTPIYDHARVIGDQKTFHTDKDEPFEKLSNGGYVYIVANYPGLIPASVKTLAQVLELPVSTDFQADYATKNANGFIMDNLGADGKLTQFKPTHAGEETTVKIGLSRLAVKTTLVINIETFEFIKKDDRAFTCEGHGADPQADDLASIIYTSGTSGKAKGVMLSHRNFCQNIIAASHAQKAGKKDRWLSILPMSHTYEMAFSVLYPLYAGGCVFYLRKPPTPSILLDAMKKIRPTIMCAVPLIIEKVYKNSVVPTIEHSRILSWMKKRMPGLLYWLVGRKLYATFGGRLRFFGIGGAKVDSTVLRLDVRQSRPVEVRDEKLLFETVKAGFGKRRKTMKNAITGLRGLDKGAAAAVLERAGIDPSRRAETLSLEEFAALADSVYQAVTE